MIIGISGKMGHGKDTVGKIIQDLYPQYNFEIKKFADKVKQCASIVLNIPVEAFEDQNIKKKFLPEEWSYDRVEIDNEVKIVEYFKEDMNIRTFLQLFATDACRNNVHENFWVNALFSDYTPDKNWIITDVRFMNEVIKILDKDNSFLLRVNRDIPIPENEHSSETQLDNYDFYYKIDNNGDIEELESKIKNLLDYWEI